MQVILCPMHQGSVRFPNKMLAKLKKPEGEKTLARFAAERAARLAKSVGGVAFVSTPQEDEELIAEVAGSGCEMILQTEKASCSADVITCIYANAREQIIKRTNGRATRVAWTNPCMPLMSDATAERILQNPSGIMRSVFRVRNRMWLPDSNNASLFQYKPIVCTKDDPPVLMDAHISMSLPIDVIGTPRMSDFDTFVEYTPGLEFLDIDTEDDFLAVQYLLRGGWADVRY